MRESDLAEHRFRLAKASGARSVSIGMQKGPPSARKRDPGDGRAAGQVRSAASIAPEAARRLDRDDLVEIKIDNYLQGIAGGALLQIFGQRVEPGAIFGLQGGEDSDGITPALGTAASVDSLPVTEYRPDCSADGAMPGAWRSALVSGLSPSGRWGIGLTPKRYVTEPGGGFCTRSRAQARCLKRQDSLPVSMISQ